MLLATAVLLAVVVLLVLARLAGSTTAPPLPWTPAAAALARSLAGQPASVSAGPPVNPYGAPEPLPSQTAIGTGANAQAWAAEILDVLGAPAGSAGVSSLVGWFGQEDNHGFAGQEADGIGENNPLSVTGDTPGITGSDGAVPSGAGGPPNLTFPTVAAGVNALKEALASYPAILSALTSGAGMAGNSAVSAELRAWSGGGYGSV